MSDDAELDNLSLTDALLRWGDPALIEAVRVNDVMISKTIIEKLGRPVLAGNPISATEWELIPLGHRTRALAMYDEAWERLMRDFKAQIENGTLHLAGVSTKKSSNTMRAPIPGVWAADLTFDFTSNVVNRHFERFIAIRVANKPFGSEHRAKNEEGADNAGAERRVVEVRDTLPAGVKAVGRSNTEVAKHPADQKEVVPDPGPDRAKRGRGRPSFPFARFAAAAQDVRWEGPNSIVADNLIKKVAEMSKDEKVLKRETVVRHLRRIYELADKAPTG